MNDREGEIRARIRELRAEHRDLDERIDRLADQPLFDQLELRRMKKRRLSLKDTIERFESMLIPDLDA